MTKASTRPMDLRHEALRLLSNGLYVLTACEGEMVHAAAISWVSQVSFRPPLVMLALRRNSHLLGAVRGARRCALNILAADQAEIVSTFLEHRTGQSDANELAGFAFRMSLRHCPLFTDALGWIELRVAAEPAVPGDHSLLLGEVTSAGIRRQATPMVLGDTRWAYGGLRES